ncbi:MAG: hypothetical protein ACIALR_05775, partial [Blastopirellula sp. JB062]
LFLSAGGGAISANAEVHEIGNRLELFVDDALIESTEGGVSQQVQQPKPREVVIEHDEPWEGNTCAYYTVFQDNGVYRMFYRSQQFTTKQNPHWGFAAYAESKDGVHWTKPNIGEVTFKGSSENNILSLKNGRNVNHNFTAFRDDNPSTPDSARYKGWGGLGHGLDAYQSADCLKWEKIQDKPLITNGKFDSQNIAFWDAYRNEYRAYWRIYPGQKVRAIRTATSKDFLHWENEADLRYTHGLPAVEHPPEDLYTNAIQPYFRAPHLFVGFPTRFFEESEQVEPVFMASRDGVTFHSFPDAVIPRDAPDDRDLNRSNYMVWGMVQLPGKPNEISVYGTENYFQSTPSRVRRFVYRLDGFVALHAGPDGGRVTTRPLRYQGEKLLLNFVVPPQGALSVEVLDEAGDVIGVSEPLQGDAVDAAVVWKRDPHLSKGTVRLRFNLKDADLYSYRFQ